MSAQGLFYDAVYAACPEAQIETIRNVGPGFTAAIVYRPTATAPQQSAGNAAAAAFDWVAAALAAPKAEAKAVFADSSPDPNPLAAASRGFALVTLDEVNALRDWITSFKAATAAATTLADLKTRVAALSNTPARTAIQLRQAIRDKIDLNGG